MKKTVSSILIALMVALLIAVPGCSSSKTAGSGKNSPATLAYKMGSQDSYGYTHTTVTDQYMDVQGQSVAVSAKTLMGFDLKNVKSVADAISFDVIIDTAGISMATMGESTVTDMKLKGTEFQMTIEPGGKGISYGNASEIIMGMGTGGDSDLGSMFTGILPVFSRSEAMPGDVWSSSDTISTKSKVNESYTVSNGNNTFVGYEKINGRDCAHITAEISGRREMKMNTQGMDMQMSFPFTGTEAVWFDTSEGVVVKYESSVKGDGTVEVLGMGMTIPVAMNIKSVLELK